MFRLKGRLLSGLLCVMLAATLVMPASAHGCHGGRRSSRAVQTTVTVCPYEDCTCAGRHVHGLSTYCGYDHSGGFCDGSCRALCPYEDCAVTGRHLHDGVGYCGSAHECGFCDGSCVVSTVHGCGHNC